MRVWDRLEWRQPPESRDPRLTLVAASPLTTAAFHDAVLSLSPAVAVFDCDGTMWSGDAGSGFMAYTIETGLLSREAVEWLDERYRRYTRGEVSELAICGEMVQVYAGCREQTMREAARRFFAERVEANIFPEIRSLIGELQQRGTDIWAVSSTNDWVIEEAVERFGIPAGRVLCARVEVENGVVTDRLIDVPTDEGKVVALRRAGVMRPDAVLGNSVHDAAMLSIARRAFPVNPTAGLVKRSAVEGWAVYYPESVRPDARAV